MNISLHDLSRTVSKSSGYLSYNRDSGALRTIGGNFLSRLVVWIRLRTNPGYRDSVAEAKREVMASMLSDEVYGENFRQKIEGLDKKKGLFFDNKPLSARKVRRFIDDVKQDVDHVLEQRKADEALRVGLVNWVSGKGGTIASGETFENNVSAMLAAKIGAQRGVQVKDVDLRGIGDEINQAALNDREGMATATDGAKAQAYVSKVMSRVLDERIAVVRTRTQEKLRKRLAVSGLADAAVQKLDAQIASSKIATMDELDSSVNQAVIKQIDEEFPTLLKQIQEKRDFHDELSRLSEVRKQLREQFASQTKQRMLSVAAVRDKAEQLLSRWVESKQEALLACRESKHVGIANALIKLTLRVPHVDKAHIQSFRRTIEQTLDEIYEKDRASFAAMKIDKTKLFTMLHKLDHRDVLSYNLYKLLKETQASGALFGDTPAQVPDSKTVAQEYIESLSKSMVASYAQVSALQGKIPQHIYDTMMEKVSKGYVWEPRFISAANGLHIDSLVKNHNEGLYQLLDSPQVARKKIGSKEDFVSFTLDDLLQAMLGPKNINDDKNRRHAINQVVPKEVRQKLLDELDQQLSMVRSRVMNTEDADALFQRGTVRFLRALKIDFEAMASPDED